MDEVQQETFMGPTNTTKAYLGLQGYGENADCTDITGFCQPFVRKENHGAETWCDHASSRCPYVTLSKSIQTKFSQKSKCQLVRLLSLRETSLSCCTLPSLKQHQQCFLWSLMSTQKRILRSRGFVCLKALRNLYNNYDYSVLCLSYILYPCVCLSRLCVACTQTSLALTSRMSSLLRDLGSHTLKAVFLLFVGLCLEPCILNCRWPWLSEWVQGRQQGESINIWSLPESLGSTVTPSNNHKLQGEC